MKKQNKYKFIILILAIVTLSCTESIPVVDGQHPFIVTQIESTACCGDGLSIYTGTSSSRVFNGNHQNLPKIVLPTKMYNIGDTITLKK
jgi:hypothetical protein